VKLNLTIARSSEIVVVWKKVDELVLDQMIMLANLLLMWFW
jgi:hypothetical protein